MIQPHTSPAADAHRTLIQRRHRALAPTAALALCLVLSGCGGGEETREYAIPSGLCGTAVTDALRPFFPPGKEISSSEKDGSGMKTCDVAVDDKKIMTTTQAWIEGGKTTAYFAAGLTLEELPHAHDGERFRYSGTEAFGKTRGCVDETYKQELYAAVQVWDSEHEDADAMKSVILAYTAEVQRSAECAEGAL
ncbi:hypothetical protein AB0D49_19940 [Streptomyces sp. NPDC048290]|uniref:hypothetical protein n=1 Tax=Streptomyces sp. NPDC048290 TaxID=3155811 RepID=UPI0034140139